MKKLLFLLAGLLFSILPSSAQQKIADITSTVVTKINDLTSGYYIINCNIPKTANDAATKPSGSLYYNSDRQDRPFDVDQNGFIFADANQISSENAKYIWYVKNDNGDITIRNISQKIYFPSDGGTGQNMKNPATKAAGVFTGSDKSFTDVIDRTMEGIVLVLKNTNYSIYANWETSKDPNLSLWDRGDGEIMFQFVKVQNINFNINYPFHTSAAPSDENFNPNTRWQLLSIGSTGDDANYNNKSNYLYYTDDNTIIKTSEQYTTEDKYLWAFHVNEDNSIVMYNKAAGPTKVLAAGAMTGDKGGGTFPKFVAADNVPSDQIATWNALKSIDVPGRDGFYLYRGDNQSDKLNNRSGLSFWTGGANAGSTFWVIPYVDYTIKCVDENGTELQTVTGSGVAGTTVTLPSIDFLTPASATYNDQSLSLENNNTQITLPEDYDCVIKVTYNINLPFEVSESYEKAKWHHIQMHNTSNESFMEYVSDNQIIGNQTKDLYNNAQYWCIVGDLANGFKLYNKVAGAGKAVTFATSGNATMGDSNAATAVWQINVSTANNITNKDKKFTLKTKTTNSGNVYLNMNGSKVLAFWNANDDGSTMVAYPVVEEMEDLLNDPHLGAVGTVQDPEAIRKAIDSWKLNPTADGFSNIQTLCSEIIQFEPNKYYRLKTSPTDWQGINVTKYLTAGTKLTGMDYSPTSASQIWRINQEENNTYTLESQGVYSVAPTGTGIDVTSTANKETAAKFTVGKRSTSIAYGFKVKEMYLHFKKGDQESINGYNVEEDACFWYLYPAKNIDLTISEVGYSTAKYPFAVTLPEGIKAYTGTIITEDGSNKVFLLNEVPEGKIPAETPVVLAGEANQTYTLTIDSENTNDPITSNDLAGTLLPETIAEGTTIYGLSQYEGVVGFYKLADNATNRTVSANKAYLPGSPATQGIRGLIFSFNDNGGTTTTDIGNTVAETEKEEYYDLQGRRVMNPSHGIYITKSGKKVFFAK